MSQRNICTVHDKILGSLKDMYRFVKNYEAMDKDDLRNAISEVEYLISIIEDLTEEAKECGQTMENRLKDYRDAIEGLGFAREK